MKRLTAAGVALALLCFGSQATGQPPASRFDPERDLISLHYDHAPDRDDGQSAAADRTILQSLLGVDWIRKHVVAVSGAYGKNAREFNAGSDRVMDAAWNDCGGWLAGHTRREQVVAELTRRWLEALKAGGNVWVKEGGQSDVTADVVRRILQQWPALRTAARILVVQHSRWNEEQTTGAALDYTRQNTHYVRIRDANTYLNVKGGDLAFVTAARAHPAFGPAWKAAFAYYPPEERLDFSDTGELMHILGLGELGIDGFTARFLDTSGRPYDARRDGDIVQLEDKASQTVVSIITSVGNMAYAMTVKGQNILRFPFATIDDYRAKPAGRHGIPLLAPWGNRLDEQAFYANGRRYAFDMQLGNVTGAIPIHGFMSLTDQWQTVELKHDAKAAWFTSRLDAYRQPSWMRQWPFAHTIEMTYRLAGGVLEVGTKVVNHSTEPMPVALGYHPWFQLTDSPREEWTVVVPARTRWLLSYQKVPTGQTEPADAFFPGFKGALRDYNLDDVFTDLVRDAEGRVTTTLKGRRQQIEMTQGPNYRALIVYSPNPKNTGLGSQIPPRNPNAPSPAPAQPGRGASPGPATANPLATPNFICFEPMAGITNGLNLAHRGVYKELQSIEPGGTWQERFWIKPSGF